MTSTPSINRKTDRQTDRQTDSDLYTQHDEALPATGAAVELGHFLDREVAADVGVNDEEGPGVPPEDLVPEVVDPPGCAQGAVLLQVPAVGGAR